MTQSPRQSVEIHYADWRQALPVITQCAFVLAIALSLARSMMLEIMHEPIDALANSTPAPRTCGPAGSVMLDLLCIVPAMLVLCRRVLDRSYIVRLSIAQGLLALFAMWAFVSTIWSGNRPVAMVSSFHLIAAAAMFWAAAQLVRSWGRLRIVAGACLALLLALIFQTVLYKFSDQPDTVRYWQEHRTEQMQSHGWREGDFALKQYEQKLTGGDIVGFQSSPNTLAAITVLLSVVVVGAGLQRMANRDESGLIGATFLPIAPAVWVVILAKSNAAFVTPVIASMILGVSPRFEGMLSRARKATLSACAVAAFVGVLALIGHGLYHGTLPSASLNFRWRYWTAAMRIVRAHPLIGVGYANFANAYLGVRLPAAAEEIKDPHNLVVRAMSELGLVGTTILVGWLLRAFWEWTLPTTASAGDPQAKRAPPGSRRMLLTTAFIAISAITINVLASVDLTAGVGWVNYELLKHLVYAALLLIGITVIAIESSKCAAVDERPAPWIARAMLAGVVVFLIHNTIDFSLFEIGPMLMFFVIGGALIGVRMPSVAGEKKRTAVAVCSLAALLAGWFCGLIFIELPLLAAEDHAYAGDVAFRDRRYSAAAEHYQSAYTNAPVKDADYALRAARAQMAAGNDGMARTNLALAVDADTSSPMGYLTRARYDLDRHPDRTDDTRRDFERALLLNPQDLETRIEYGEVLDKLGDRQAAVEQFQAALKTNDAFDPAEPKRLTPQTVDRLRSILERKVTTDQQR